MSFTMRLEESGVISVSSQVFTTQTIYAKFTYCWIIHVAPFKLNHSVFFTYYSVLLAQQFRGLT